MRRLPILLAVLLGLGLTLGLEVGLGRMLASSVPAVVFDIQRPDQLVPKLELLRRFQGFKVVVLGDSLIYGQAMEAHGDSRWRSHTLSAALDRRLRAEMPGQELLVLNLGLNGALPADLEALARVVLPARPDVVVFDVHLRPFSQDFAAPAAVFSRPWLSELVLTPDGRVAVDPLLSRSRIWRSRGLIQGLAAQSQLFTRARMARLSHYGLGGGPDPDILLLQIKSRLDSVELHPGNPQRVALEGLLSQLRASGQPSVVFYAKENPEQLAGVIEPERYRRLTGELRRLVLAGDPNHVVWVPPAEGLGAGHYLDFMHLDASGYEVLANQLLEPVITVGRARAGS